MSDCLVVIPAYNESKSILSTVADLKNNAPSIDYIVVNDGSKDDTLQILKDNKIPHLDLSINLGIGGAVQMGYKYAIRNNYKTAVQFDGDGQHLASELDKLLKSSQSGVDLVIGSRFKCSENEFFSTPMRRFGILIIRFVLKICTGQNISDPTSGFRALSGKALVHFSEDYPYDYPEPEVIAISCKLGYKVDEVGVKMQLRKEGESSINHLNSVFYMLKVSICIFLANWREK